MLLALHRLARRIRWCLPVTIVLGFAGLAGALVSLFFDGGRLGHLLEPSLVLTLWGMMLFSFIRLFQTIPPPVLPHDDFMTRLGNRIILALYSLLAFLVVVVAVALIWMSVRLITLE